MAILEFTHSEECMEGYVVSQRSRDRRGVALIFAWLPLIFFFTVDLTKIIMAVRT